MDKNDMKPNAMSEAGHLAMMIAVLFLIGSMAYNVDRFVITVIVGLFSMIAGYCIGRIGGR